MRKNVKNYLLKMSIIVMALLMTFPCVPVKASTGNGGDVVSPCAYYSPGVFSFSNWTQNTDIYDGTFMAVEVAATSTTGISEKVTVEVYVQKTGKTHTYTLNANGINNKFDYIYLGLSGGSAASIMLSCSNSSAVITAKVTSYSW